MVSEVAGHVPGTSEIGLDIQCSKGTYVRSLGCDIGEVVGTVGHLSILRRL